MESDIYKLEPADNYENETDENDEKVPTRWELLILDGDIPWRCEIPYTGENGNCFSSGSFFRKRSRNQLRSLHKVKNMDVAVKLNLNQPMTRDLITLVIDKEMKIEDQAEMRDLAFNYMTLMVEQGYVFSKDPAKRYTIREMLDLTYAYLDNFNDAVKRWKLSTKTYC